MFLNVSQRFSTFLNVSQFANRLYRFHLADIFQSTVATNCICIAANFAPNFGKKGRGHPQLVTNFVAAVAEAAAAPTDEPAPAEDDPLGLVT